MSETFLILLSSGIMLTAALSNPREVTLNWLRLCGIIALAIGGLGLFFMLRSAEQAPRMLVLLSAGMLAAVLGQLAFAQLGSRTVQRASAALAAAGGVYIGHHLLRPAAGAVVDWMSFLSALGIAAMSGIVLMEMLLGHAYLTASQMTMRPFRRLNLLLAAALVYRVLTAVGLVLVLQSRRPIYMLWGYYGLFILSRWLIGLAIPAVFVYMTHDCINRRATQSATGILYVAGVLVFIGEIIAVYLVRATNLPF